jgi:hypothetical protein
MGSGIRINTFFYGFYLLFLLVTAASNIFTKPDLDGSRLFFLLYAVGQALFETSLLIAAGYAIEKYLPRFCFRLFLSCVLFFFCLHVCDYLLDRILNESSLEALNSFVLQESWEQFLLLLDASGAPNGFWIAFFVCLFLFPLSAIVLYRATDTLSSLVPIHVDKGHLFQLLLYLPLSLFIWDFSASKAIYPDAYTAFVQSLPWKGTLLRPETASLTLPAPPAPPLSEEEMSAAIDQVSPLLTRPNIYLFILESFREDMVNPDTAPHLFAFKQANFSPTLSVSNANWTLFSWYSIFFADTPFHWKKRRDGGWRSGSPPLQYLKRLGYQIRVYSSSELAYYGMESYLFGPRQHLLSSYRPFHQKGTPPYLSDKQAIEALIADANRPDLQQGQLFIIFLDATHFGYSWPQEEAPRFAPFAQAAAYFQAFQSAGSIERIKNRYKNAVHYVDALFGRFISSVPHLDGALIAVTGDHGEEFYEHGHLFHGSHLTHEQIHVPLYFHFPSPPSSFAPRLASQVDLFPTLIDALTGVSPPFFAGYSLLRGDRAPHAFSARFNGGQTPYEFCLHNGAYKLILQFSHPADVYASTHLRLLSVRTFDDRPVPESRSDLSAWIERHFYESLHPHDGPLFLR